MEKTEEKLLLVDGHNLLFQMFYGMPARIVNHEGRAIQGTLGFVGALLKIIRRIQPGHVAVIFDGEHENQRRDISEDYKANRPDYGNVPEEENPFSQLPDVYRALNYLGIPHWETQEYEADDEIAAYVHVYGKRCERCYRCEPAETGSAIQENQNGGTVCAVQKNQSDSTACTVQKNQSDSAAYAVQKNQSDSAACTMQENRMRIIISSFDSDFFQLIADNVSVLRYRGEKTVLCDVAYIREKLGIEPSQYAEYKALTGDKADNIGGIRGIGPKTAADLIQHFGDLEELLARRDEIKKPSLRKVLMEEEEHLRGNYRLIRLDGGVPIPRQLEELAWRDCGMTTTEVLKGIGLKQ